MPTGAATGFFETQSTVFTVRTPSTTNRRSRPVTVGKSSGTTTDASFASRSGTRRHVDGRRGLAVGLDADAGGHGVAPVGDHPEVEVVERDRVARAGSGGCRCPGPGRPGSSACVGSPSMALTARAPMSPGRRRELVATSSDPSAAVTPSTRSITASDARAEMRAWPETPKARAVGSANARAMASSGSLRSGMLGRVRCRVRTMARGWSAEPAPAAVEQVAGEADHLVEAAVAVAEADVGEADGAEPVVAVAGADVVVEDLDREGAEGAPRKRSVLAGLAPGRGAEVDVDRVAAVEAQPHLGDPAVLHAVVGLLDRDAVGGAGLVVGELDPLALRPVRTHRPARPCDGRRRPRWPPGPRA